jgi:hypothetical protein
VRVRVRKVGGVRSGRYSLISSLTGGRKDLNAVMVYNGSFGTACFSLPKWNMVECNIMRNMPEYPRFSNQPTFVHSSV